MGVSFESFDKSNEQIRAENDALSAAVQSALAAGDSGRAMAEATLAVHQRLGDVLMWLKERR